MAPRLALAALAVVVMLQACAAADADGVKLFSLLPPPPTKVLSTVAKGAQTAAQRGLGALGLSNLTKSIECSNSKPTLFLMSGIGGTQMRGTHTGGVWPDCGPIVNSTVVWYADHWFLERKLACWGRLMSLKYNETTHKWTNSTGTELWPDAGVNPGEFPGDSKQRLYYALLMKHLLARHGYIPGKDLFIIPFDWRVGVQGLEERGILKQMTENIAAAVDANCGQKAILITHSFGANVMGTILQKPKFEAWKKQYVKGWIPTGAPFGGCAATVVQSFISGDFFKLFPVFSNSLPIKMTSSWKTTVIGQSVYNFAFGLPSWTWMLPRVVDGGEFTADHPVVVTPNKTYAVKDMRQLLLDMGDVGGARLMDESYARSDQMLENGPVGVETYCLYSTAVPTSATLHFNQSVPYRFPMRRPVAVNMTAGDGVVDLASLRLCSRFAPKENIFEVDGPMVDHSTILAHPLGLNSLSQILNRLGVPNLNPFVTLTKTASALQTALQG